MSREEKEIAAGINDLFLKFTEVLLAHVSDCHFPSDPISLNITEHFLIEYLEKESFASMSKLSQLFHVAPTTMTSIVDRLVKRGYLKRRRAQQDRRMVLVTLSAKGKQWNKYHHLHSEEIFISFLSKLPDRGIKFRQNLGEILPDIEYLNQHLIDI